MLSRAKSSLFLTALKKLTSVVFFLVLTLTALAVLLNGSSLALASSPSNPVASPGGSTPLNYLTLPKINVTNLYGLASGDFNGDGLTDLAFTSGSNVGVALASSNGTYLAPVYYATSALSSFVTVTDFNGDGKPDLATASNGGSNGNAFLNDGNGVFTRTATFLLGIQPSGIQSADMNGDGKADLVAPNSYSGTVSVTLGNGDGTFQDTHVYWASQNTKPQSMTIADFNGDGKLDVATGNAGTYNIGIYLGNGDGSLNSPITYDDLNSNTPGGIISGDFNKDGKPDLVVSNSTGQTVSFLAGNGDGTFQPKTDFNVGFKPTAFQTSDFDQDGNLDLAVTNGGSNSVSILRGNGDGTFKPSTDYATGGSNPGALTLGKFFGTAQDGLAFVNLGSSEIRFLLNKGGGTFAGNRTYLTGQPNFSQYAAPYRQATGDFNGDGKVDLAISNYDIDGTLAVMLGDGNGGFSSKTSLPAVQSINALVAADINNDQKLDLVAGNTGGTNSLVVFLGNGDGTFQSFSRLNSNGNIQNLAAADFNGDGKLDLVTASLYSSDVKVLINSSTGTSAVTFQSPVSYPASSGTYGVATGDFNGDGKLDLVAGNSSAGTISLFLGNGNGTFQPKVDYQTPFQYVRGVKIGDFNNDTKPDVVVVGANPTSFSVFLGNGDGTLQTRQDFATGSSESIDVSVADLNKDGNQDVIISNQGSNGGLVTVYQGRGDGTFQTGVDFYGGNSNRTVAVADFNGDTLPDLAVPSYTGHTVTILLDQGESSFPAVQLALTSNGSKGVSGYAYPIQAKALTIFGTTATSYRGSILFTSSVPGTTLPDNYAFTADDKGFHNFEVTFANPGNPSISVFDINDARLTGSIQLQIYGPPASISPISGTPQTTQIETNFGLPLKVVVRDAINNPFAGVLIEFAAPDSGPGGSFSGGLTTTVTTDASGIAVAPSFKANTIAGSFTVKTRAVDYPGLGTVNFALTNTAGSPTSIKVISGTPQSTTVATAFTTPLKTQVTDVFSNPVQGVAVTFSLPTSFGATGTFVASPVVTTDNNGVANAPTLTAGCKAGNFNVTAVYSGTTLPAIFSLTSRPGNFAKVTVDEGDEQSAPVNSILKTNLAAITRDVCGNPTGGVVITFEAPETGPSGTFNSDPHPFQGSDPGLELKSTSGSARTVSVMSDLNGKAIAPAFATNNLSGRYIVTARAEDATSAIFYLLNRTTTPSATLSLPTFDSIYSYTGSFDSKNVVKGDFNRDGLPDLASVNTYNNNIIVMYGTGAGNFWSVTYPVGSGPGALVTGDFNGDNLVDIAGGGYKKVFVLLGQADGTFLPPIFSDTNGNVQFSMAAGDFNQDGKLDLVGSDLYGSTAFEIVFGNGDGTFQPPQYIPGFSSVTTLIAVDLNGDGKLDVVAGDSSQNFLKILYGKGDGTFQPIKTVGTSGTSRGVSVGDVNGDGRLDLISGDASTGVISILLAKSDGTYTAPITYACNFLGGQVVLSDFNADGKVDLLVPSKTPAVLLGNGDGTFNLFNRLALGGTVKYLTVADFNQDNKLDIAAIYIPEDTTRPGGLSITLGKGDGSFISSSVNNIFSEPVSLARGDFNEDGNQDLLIGDSATSNISLVQGRADGTFSPPVNLNLGPYNENVIKVQDIDKDGKLDIIAESFFPRYLKILLGKGDGTFNPGPVYSLDYFATDLALGDFNNDGNVDIATNTVDVGPNFILNNFSILLGNGNGTFQSPQLQTNCYLTTFLAKDLNDDGKMDLMGFDNEGYACVLLGNGDGTFTRQPLPDNVHGQAIVADYFNGDKILDLAISDLSTVTLLFGNGNGTFTLGQYYGVGFTNNDSSLTVGDFNQDGRLDVAKGSSASDTVSILLGRGDGTFITGGFYNIGASSQKLVTWDFNKDNRDDLVGAALWAGPGVLLSYTPQPAVKFNVSIQTPAKPGQTNKLQIAALDSNNRIVPNYIGTVHLSSTDPTTNLPTDFTFSASDAGVHTFDFVLKAPHSQTLKAEDKSDPSIKGNSSLVFAEPPLPPCDWYEITAVTDDGTGGCGTLSYALGQSFVATESVTITFKISTVSLTAPLPVISNTNGVAITLDGGCVADPSSGRGIPGVQIVSNAPGLGTGLLLQDKVHLNGLKIIGFSGYAVEILGDNNQLSCNWLGTADGETASNNNSGGIKIGRVGGASADNNSVGQADSPVSGNLLSGNNGWGIEVANGVNNSSFYSWVGVTQDGSSPLKNGAGALKVLPGAQFKFGEGNRLRS